MSPFFAIFLVLLLASSSYAAGRLHGQLSYRVGYRFGYRQGYFDGDRGAWNKRRRDTQAAIASLLAPPASGADRPARRGTTYRGAAVAPVVTAARSTPGMLTAPVAEMAGPEPGELAVPGELPVAGELAVPGEPAAPVGETVPSAPDTLTARSTS